MADIQELITDLRIRDNLTVGLLNAKKAVSGFGDAAAAEAAKASAAFDRAGASIGSKFSADFKRGITQGLGIGTVQLVSRGVSELTDFLGESVKAAAEEEAQIGRLNRALKENAQGWDGDIAAVERVIQARQSLAFSDDELRDSLTALTGATGDYEQALKLQSLAADLARFRNISLAEASDQLVKVQAGSFRALKSLGIELDKTATSTEALAAIQKVVAGQAEEFGDKGAASIKRFGIAVENLKEDIGTGLMPAVELLSGQMDDALKSQGDQIAKDAAAFVRTATIEQIKAAREGVAEQLAKTKSLFGPAAAGPDIQRVLDILDAGLAKTADGMEETGRASLQFTASLKDLTDGIAAAGDASPEMLRVAKATIEASEAHAALAVATAAAAEAGSDSIAAIQALAAAQTVDVAATKALKDAQDALAESAKKIPAAMLGAGRGTDALSDSLLRVANSADAARTALSFFDLQAARTTPTVSIGGENVPTGSGTTLADSFLSDLDQDQRNLDAAAARERERLADRQRLKSEAEAARDKALSEAKAKAQERYNRTLANTKDIATTLFDAQHARALRAIKDTETLAQKQHEGALQQISDALKVRLEQNAAPVTAAEERQRQIDLARQRRDLNESRAAAEASGDPEAIRSAVEAQQSFEANQRINALRLEQAKLDAQAQEEARSKQKAADDQLAAAKIASAKDIEAESLRNKTQRARFDKELEALKRRDAGAPPAKVKKDIAALEEKFGITTDVKGFHHIEDLAAVAKDLKPTFTGIGDAAAGAAPGLTAVGASATAAASGLAVFIKSLGELKVLELPIPKPIQPPEIRQPATVPDQPRLSEAEILATAIKTIPVEPIILFQPHITYSPPVFSINGRQLASYIAAGQSPSATPGVRNGSVSPRP